MGIVRRLVAYHSDISTRNQVFTFICIHPPALQFILSSMEWNGILVVLDATKNGRTALHLACMSGHADIADFLISLGAEINARDNVCCCI
jgi:ankyrin repeat protein